MDVDAALAELAGLSAQVTRAVVAAADGTVEGALGADAERAARLARHGADLLEAASRARLRTDEVVSHVEVVIPAGGVFAFREGGRTIVATTVPEPMGGLVLYDLRTVLRRLEEEQAS